MATSRTSNYIDTQSEVPFRNPNMTVKQDHQYILPPRVKENIDESYWRKVLDETQLTNMQENIINNFIINPREAANFLHKLLMPNNDILSRIVIKSLNDIQGRNGNLQDGIYYLNKENIIEIISDNTLYCFYSKEVATRLPQNVKETTVGRNCLVRADLSDMEYITSDKLTNATLISYILNRTLLSDTLPPLCVRLLRSSIIENEKSARISYINIYENIDLGSLDKISFIPGYTNTYTIYPKQAERLLDNVAEFSTQLVIPEILKHVFTQITMALDMLYNYIGFNHGNLLSSTVLLSSSPISYEYMGLYVDSPFTCKLFNFTQSSCMIRTREKKLLRFFNSDVLADFFLTINPFDYQGFKSGNTYYYTINNANSQIYARSRHMGIPYYRSFDYYTWIISMLLHPSIYYSFFVTDSLYNIFWDPIWDSPTERIVRHKLYMCIIQRAPNTMDTVLDILRDIQLKCDAVDLILDKLIAEEVDGYEELLWEKIESS